MNKLAALVLMCISVLIIVPASSAELGSISGYNINDTNGNGTWDAGETGIPGWNITLISSTGDTVTTNTSISGFYMFEDLLAGTYIVSEEVQDGWINIGDLVMVINPGDGEISTNNNFTNMFVEPVQALTVLTPAPTITPTTAAPTAKPIAIPALDGSIALVVTAAVYIFVIKKREEKK